MKYYQAQKPTLPQRQTPNLGEDKQMASQPGILTEKQA
jgi:hypothetical protein